MGKKEKPLEEFDRECLLAVRRLGSNAYGVTIKRAVQKSTQVEPSMVAVFDTLRSLEREGLVSSRVGETTNSRQGQPRLYFEIKEARLRALSVVAEPSSASASAFGTLQPQE